MQVIFVVKCFITLMFILALNILYYVYIDYEGVINDFPETKNEEATPGNDEHIQFKSVSSQALSPKAPIKYQQSHHHSYHHHHHHHQYHHHSYHQPNYPQRPKRSQAAAHSMHHTQQAAIHHGPPPPPPPSTYASSEAESTYGPYKSVKHGSRSPNYQNHPKGSQAAANSMYVGQESAIDHGRPSPLSHSTYASSEATSTYGPYKSVTHHAPNPTHSAIHSPPSAKHGIIYYFKTHAVVKWKMYKFSSKQGISW